MFKTKPKPIVCDCCRSRPAKFMDYRDYNNTCLHKIPVCERCLHLSDQDFWEKYQANNNQAAKTQTLVGEINLPVSKDLTQESAPILDIPQIRVWCHPHEVGKAGDDYYRVFNSFKQAMSFIKKHPEAETVPLVAFKGYEISLFAIKELEKETKPHDVQKR